MVRLITSSMLVLGAALSGAHSAANAQSGADPSVQHYKIDIHFVTGKDRKPVPYEMNDGVLLFQAQINGQAVWAMLDNESGDSLIDAAFARTHGLTLGPPLGPLRTPGGTLERRRVEGVRLSIQGQASFTAPLSAADLSFASRVAGKPISVVLGKEYFESLGFLIDPRSKELQFGPSGSLTVPATIPYVELLNDRPQVEVRVNGHPAVVTVDLGYNGTLSLNDAAWAELGLNDAPSTNAKSANFDGRFREMKSTRVDEVSLGPETRHDVDVRLDRSFPEDGDGIIGLGFLSKFIFAIDEKSRRIWFISGV